MYTNKTRQFARNHESAMFTTALKLADSVFSFSFFFFDRKRMRPTPPPPPTHTHTHTKDVASRNEVRTVEVKHDKKCHSLKLKESYKL